jgi:hypothetical protein
VVVKPSEYVIAAPISFKGKAITVVSESGPDADGNNTVELTDAVRLLGFLFIDSEPPEAPFRTCGPDLDAGALTCDRYEPCE